MIDATKDTTGSAVDAAGKPNGAADDAAVKGPPAAGKKPIAERAINDLSLKRIERLTTLEARGVCVANRLPTDVDGPTMVRQIKAVKLGGDRQYVHGYTLCPFCRHLCRVEQTISRDPDVRWMQCSGPRRCRFKR